METEIELITSVVIVLACALVVLFVGRRLRLPFIIGYFITGIIVGPACLGLVTEEQVSLLAELGVILLMFTIGLEMSLKTLLSMKKIVLIGGSLQLIITTAAVWAIMVAVGFDSNVALFIGFLVAHSSTAVIMNLYQSSGEIDTQHGKIALGLLIFQDLNVIPMMLMVPLLAGEEGANLMDSLINFGMGMVLLVIILVAAIYFVPKLLTRVALTRSKELFIISIVAICFGIAWIMSLNGVSLALGAFLAGIAISGSEYSHEVIGQIMPLRDVLTSFFFVSIGMMLNLTYVFEHIVIIIAIAFILLFGKTIINYISVKAIGIASGAALLSAIGLSQVGEFSFILGSVGLESGILTNDIYQVFLAITIVTMAVTPFYVAAGPKIAKKLIKPKLPCGNEFGEEDSVVCHVKESLEHVIIVGYGLSGRYVAKALKRVDIPYIILEMNADTVRKEKAKGENIVYGDASREAMLEYADIDKARSIVITIPNLEATKAIISIARRLNPKISIITRSRFISETEELYLLGADEVIVDERESAIQIFRRILANEPIPQQDLDLYVRQIRNDLYDEYIEKPIRNSEQDINRDNNNWFENIILRAKDNHEKSSKHRTTVEQIHVGKGSAAAGKSISDLSLRRGGIGISIIAVRREDANDTVVTPDGNTVLLEGDTAVVIGEPSAITACLPLFMEKSEPLENFDELDSL